MKTLLLFLVAAASALGQVGVSIQPADHALIPSSIRSVYAKVEGTENLEVHWTTSGGCALQSGTTVASPQRVQAPSAGGLCKLSKAPLSNLTPSFTSPVSCRVTASSAADPSKSASIVLPVCSPDVMLSTFPLTTILYKNQFAVIQSDLRGSTNTGVIWTLAKNPGGAGSLSGGSANRHAIFSASAPGTYLLTATSKADPTKKASSTIYVTDNALPAPAPDHTEPVDCTAAGRGKTFEVGPARAYHDLLTVPWTRLQPGDTVRIHNDDTTGKAPTTYHQRLSIAATGSAERPIRICGVSDDHGVKPIIDGNQAVSPKDNDWSNGVLESLGLITLYNAPHKYDTTPDNNQNILIEGLHLRNISPAYTYLSLQSSTPTPYNAFGACIRIQTGRDVLIRGNEFENCPQGVFSNSQTPAGGLIFDLTVEGNYFHNWGLAKNDHVHGVYLQAIGVAVQFNYFGEATAEAMGNVIKSRSVLNFIRWNYLSQTVASTARAFDLVEAQTYECYVIPYEFAFYHTPENNVCIPPHDGADSDPINPNQVAANFEAYHSDYIYGNILDDIGSEVAFVHYGYDQQMDQGPAYNRRGGTLFYWNNTHLVRRSKGMKVIFDPSSPDIEKHSYEFPSIECLNNIFASEGTTTYQWVQMLWARVIVDSNWMKPGYQLPDRRGEDYYQGALRPDANGLCNRYGRCRPGNGHMDWGRNGKPGTMTDTLYTGDRPFALDTFIPTIRVHGIAAPLPFEIYDQPSNMRFYPKTGAITLSKDQTFLGALE